LVYFVCDANKGSHEHTNEPPLVLRTPLIRFHLQFYHPSPSLSPLYNDKEEMKQFKEWAKNSEVKSSFLLWAAEFYQPTSLVGQGEMLSKDTTDAIFFLYGERVHIQESEYSHRPHEELHLVRIVR